MPRCSPSLTMTSFSRGQHELFVPRGWHAAASLVTYRPNRVTVYRPTMESTNLTGDTINKRAKSNKLPEEADKQTLMLLAAGIFSHWALRWESWSKIKYCCVLHA